MIPYIIDKEKLDGRPMDFKLAYDDRLLPLRYWFSLLKSDIEQKAINSCIECYGDEFLDEKETSSFSDAINEGFVWDDTEEGYDFWSDLSSAELDNRNFKHTRPISDLHPETVISVEAARNRISKETGIPPSKVAILALHYGYGYGEEEFIKMLKGEVVSTASTHIQIYPRSTQYHRIGVIRFPELLAGYLIPESGTF